jgi:hypothetical protein
MKKLILSLGLVLASCASVQPGSVPVADGPVARTIERVLVRSEGYLAMEQPPLPIPEEYRGPIEAAILTARTMTALPEVSGDLLLVTMGGLMDMHDAMVMSDPALDQLEREIYLEDTARLRSLFSSVDIHASAAR